MNHFANCSLNQVACRTAYSYDNSGILITSQDKITAYQLDPSQHAEKSITAISVTQFQTAFLSWERTKFVQIGDLFVERPNLISSNIEPQLQSHILEKWSQFLNSSSLTALNISTTNLSDQISHLRSYLPTQKQHSTRSRTNFILALIALSILTVILFAIILRLLFIKTKPAWQNLRVRYIPKSTTQEPAEEASVALQAQAPNVSVIY